MNSAQRERYRVAWFRLLGEMSALNDMVHDYPQPEDVIDPALAYDLEDLAKRINSLTALWVGIPA